MVLEPLHPAFATTRVTAQRIGAHILARARKATVGRIDLVPTPGGFGTPAFGADIRVIRLSAGALIIESTGAGASTVTIPLRGASLAELAQAADVSLSDALDVGHDTPDLGDVHMPLVIDDDALAQLGDWFAFGHRVIDAAVVATGTLGAPTRARIWPEHFDLAIDLAAAGGARLNLGASPGDGFHGAPYLYVGPWDSRRPGPDGYWNAPFGAVLGYEELAAAADPVAAGAAFMRDGIARLA